MMGCEKIANYMMDRALSHTSNGSYIIFFEDLNYLFNVDLPNDEGMMEDILVCLDYNIVINCWIGEDGFYLDLYRDWDG